MLGTYGPQRVNQASQHSSPDQHNDMWTEQDSAILALALQPHLVSASAMDVSSTLLVVLIVVG